MKFSKGNSLQSYQSYEIDMPFSIVSIEENKIKIKRFHPMNIVSDLVKIEDKRTNKLAKEEYCIDVCN